MAAAQDPAAGQTAESRAQRRILLALVLGQVLAGLGTGATLSLGALLITAMLIIPAAATRAFARTPEAMAGRPDQARYRFISAFQWV